MSSAPIHHCRVCHSSTLLSILDLGELAVSDFVKETGTVARYPLKLVLCDPRKGCGLLQLGNLSVDEDLLYRQYWYRSGINQSMKRALKDVALDCQRKIALKAGDVIVDIGANDGTLLSFFPQSLTRVGVEPALNIQADLQAYTSVNVPEYFTKKAYSKYVGKQLARLITSLAMFYDLDDPLGFCSDLKSCLAPDGIWVNQMTYLGTMLEKNDYPNICHEHVTYYSLTTFLEVLKRSGFKLLDVTQNEVNGGSIRTTVTHVESPLHSSAAANARICALLEREAQSQLGKITPYRQFAARVRRSRRDIRALIAKYQRSGKTVAVYGASTKGNTLLQYCGLTASQILAAYDRNPEKEGLKTVASAIPILLDVHMRKDKPDILLVLPWHFREEFLKRERAFLQSGGVMVFPLPTLEIFSL